MCQFKLCPWFQAFAVFCMLYAFFWVITETSTYKLQTPGNYPKESIHQNVLLWVSLECSMVPKFREEIIPASSFTFSLKPKAIFLFTRSWRIILKWISRSGWRFIKIQRRNKGVFVNMGGGHKETNSSLKNWRSMVLMIATVWVKSNCLIRCVIHCKLSQRYSLQRNFFCRKCSRNEQSAKWKRTLWIRRHLHLQTDGFQKAVNPFRSRSWSYTARSLEIIL